MKQNNNGDNSKTRQDLIDKIRHNEITPADLSNDQLVGILNDVESEGYGAGIKHAEQGFGIDFEPEEDDDNDGGETLSSTTVIH